MQVAPTIAAAAIGSSLCWSALDALRKKLGEGLDATTLVALFSLGQAPIFIAWWLLAPSEVAEEHRRLVPGKALRHAGVGLVKVVAGAVDERARGLVRRVALRVARADVAVVARVVPQIQGVLY